MKLYALFYTLFVLVIGVLAAHKIYALVKILSFIHSFKITDYTSIPRHHGASSRSRRPLPCRGRRRNKHQMRYVIRQLRWREFQQTTERRCVRFVAITVIQIDLSTVTLALFQIFQHCSRLSIAFSSRARDTICPRRCQSIVQQYRADHWCSRYSREGDLGEVVVSVQVWKISKVQIKYFLFSGAAITSMQRTFRMQRLCRLEPASSWLSEFDWFV